MSEAVLPKVVAAVELVYTHASHDRLARKEADSWLCEFRKQPEAWVVAHDLLAAPASGHVLQFFAAQTLHIKLRHDFHELPETEVPRLKATLLGHLVGALARADTPVVNKLRLALATIAVQTNWQTFADDILQGVASMGPEVGALAAEKTLLFVVEVIPDECRSERLDIEPQKRRDFLRALDGMAVRVLEFISRLAPSEGMAGLVNPMLRCLRAWVEHCAVPPAALIQSPLFYSTFDALAGAPGYEESFEEACDAAVGMMRTYDATRPENTPVVQEMVPRIMQLSGRLRASREQDPDAFRGFVILFTEMGEAFLDFLLSEQDVGQQAVLEILLECTAYEDPEVSRIPLQFWYRMRCRIGEFEHLVQDRIMEAYAPVYGQLLEILLPLGQHPVDASDYFADSFDVMREYVADALDDCCMMIGAQQVLDRICARLSEHMTRLVALPPGEQLKTWQLTESCLFAITCIRKRVSVRENPGFAELICALPQLPVVDALRISSYRIIGYFANVFQQRPDLLQPCFEFLLVGLGNKKTSHDAAHAMRDVCSENPVQLGEPVLGLFDSLPQAALEAVDENAILQGLSSVLSVLPAPRCAHFLQHMLAPSIVLLGRAADGSNSGEHVSRELDKVTTLMKYTRPGAAQVQGLAPNEHPVIQGLQGLWPTVAGVLGRFPAKASIVERTCRIVKHAIRSAPTFISPETIKFITDEMVRFFDAQPQSAYLYVTSISVADFSDHPVNQATFHEALVRFSQRVSTVLSSAESFDQNPEIVEEYSYLVARYLELMPLPLAQSGFIPSVLTFGKEAMRVTQREAHTGVLFSLTIFLMLGTPPRADGGPLGMGLKKDPMARLRPEEQQLVISRVQEALAAEGANLVAALINVLTSGAPFYGYDGERASAGSVIRGLMLCGPEAVQGWLVASLEQVPNEIVAPADKQGFMEELAQATHARDCTDAANRLWRRAQQGHRRSRFHSGYTPT